MCCFRKIWPSVLWHFTQSAGTSCLEQVLGLGRSVRVVAGTAVLLHHLVLELALGRLLQDGLVAAAAELVGGLQEVELRRRGVRVVATRAALLLHRLVGALRVLRHHVGVAGEAGPARARVEELAVGGGVRVVAAGAVLRLHRGVHEGLLQHVLEGGVALEAGLADGAGLELELLGGGGRLGFGRAGKRQDGGGEQEGEVPSHGGSSHFAGRRGRRRRNVPRTARAPPP